MAILQRRKLRPNEMKLLTLRVMEQDSNPSIGTLNYNSSPGFEANYFSLCASLFLQSLQLEIHKCEYKSVGLPGSAFL